MTNDGDFSDGGESIKDGGGDPVGQHPVRVERDGRSDENTNEITFKALEAIHRALEREGRDLERALSSGSIKDQAVKINGAAAAIQRLLAELNQWRGKLIRPKPTYAHPALERAAQILVGKTLDYDGVGEVDPARAEYFPFGDRSYITMLHTKMLRIRYLRVGVGSETRAANNESASDSLLDTINYAAFYWSWLQRGGAPWTPERRDEDEAWAEEFDDDEDQQDRGEAFFNDTD